MIEKKKKSAAGRYLISGYEVTCNEVSLNNVGTSISI